VFVSTAHSVDQLFAHYRSTESVDQRQTVFRSTDDCHSISWFQKLLCKRASGF